MNCIHRLLAAALLGTGALTAHAAGDWKGYAGVNCLSQDDAAAVRRSAVNQTALPNTGTGTVTVFCPIVRDVEAEGQGRVIAVAVRFRNRNPGVTGSCEFSTHDQSGYKSDTQTLAAPFGETTLSFGPLDAPAWGSYVLTCQLPGRDPASGLQSYIVNYRVDEKP
jgi:hypothetical protein